MAAGSLAQAAAYGASFFMVRTATSPKTASNRAMTAWFPPGSTRLLEQRSACRQRYHTNAVASRHCRSENIMSVFFLDDVDGLPRRTSPVWMADAVTIPLGSFVTNVPDLCTRPACRFAQRSIAWSSCSGDAESSLLLASISSARQSLRDRVAVRSARWRYSPTSSTTTHRCVRSYRRLQALPCTGGERRNDGLAANTRGLFSPGDRIFLVHVGQLARAGADVGTWFDGVTHYWWSENDGRCYRHERFVDEGIETVIRRR